MPNLTVNPAQQEAITHTAGAVQVLAGPGSGKTYVTVHRIRHLITHHGVNPANILVITFTKASALEMKERFFKLSNPERPAVWFGTFHAVFYHILRQSDAYRGYTIITESEKMKLIKKLLQMHKRFDLMQEEDCQKILLTISAVKNKGIIPEEDIRFLMTEYQNYLTEFKQLDFDDITLLCGRLLSEDNTFLGRWQKQFRYIMIDEFQDIAPQQYRIIQMLAEPENNLFVVGDDDQSIYRFRGASPKSMLRFREDYPKARQILLDVNYRCHKQIVEASLAVIEENAERFPKKIKASHEKGDGIDCKLFPSRKEEEQYLLRLFAGQKEEGTLERSCAIFRTNYECALFAQVLEQAKIPYTLKEVPNSRFSHFIIQDLLAYLKLAQGSRERRLFLRIMNRPLRYIRRESLMHEIVREEEWMDYYRNVPSIRDEIERLFAVLKSLKGRKPYLAVHYIRKVVGYDAYLMDKYGREQAKELQQAADEFQDFLKPFACCQEVDDYISQYEESLRKQREKSRNNQGKEQEGIMLMTMHASKGLEFDRVYLPGCEEGKIPSKKAATPDDIEEERRLFYVAMTRAKEELILTAVKGETGKELPSRFLKPICENKTLKMQPAVHSSSSTSSSNSAESRYSSKASATASYSSSSSI